MGVGGLCGELWVGYGWGVGVWVEWGWVEGIVG